MDDGLDDLDIDEEAALLGLSDEEIDGRGNEELEYVDEDGNPVEIGENNAELYEVANIDSDKLGSPPEDDVLELDLDAEIESFTQENPDITRESPVKTFNDRQHKENLISLTSRSEHDKSSGRRRDHSPERASERSQMDLSYSSQSLSSRHVPSDSYNEPLEYDEESEDESIADDHRERFKSERNIITLTPAKKRVDIPDTLESVISVEETAKVQAFLENEQKRKMRFKGKSGGRMKNSQNYSRPHQTYPNVQSPHQHPQHQQHPHQHPSHQQAPHQQAPHQQPPHQQPPHQQPPHQQPPHQQPPHQQPPHQQHQSQKILICQLACCQMLQSSSQNFLPLQSFRFSSAQSYQNPPASSQSRKILINPHFRGGVRLPLPVTSDQMMTVNQPPQDTMPPPVPYATSQNYAPPMYSHHDNNHPVNVSPAFNAPPPISYKPPEYPPPIPPPQPLMQQPPIWQSPPEIAPPPVSYASPPPVLNYGDPLAQVPGYHNNYNQNTYQNTGYQNVPIPPPQPISYNQPPPPVHMHTPSYNPPPVTSVNQGHYQSGQPPQNVMQKPYHEQRNLNHNVPPHAQRKGPPQNPRFPRQNEKRPSNTNIKQVPIKVPRIEHQVRKNSHVNNSNIREIPLVDTVTSSQKPSMKRSAPVVEEEDEKTKELRMKIEEQKLLREQILKRKEERRRLMASQRLTELKQRQAEQNLNVISIQRVDQVQQVKPPPGQNVVKASVKERIGIPLAKNLTPAKKKIIVVRKKANQAITNQVTNQQKKVPVRQRVGVKPPVQQPNPPGPNKPAGNPVTNQIQAPNQPPAGTAIQPGKQKVVLKPSQPNKTPPADNKTQKVPLKNNPKQNQNQKGRVQHRLGNRGNFQRQPMNQQRSPQGPPRMMQPSPRFNGPRTPHFDNPPFIGEHRMRFPGPPMRMQRQPFQDQRPPLLPFHPPGERLPFMFEPNHPRFRMQGPGFQNFRPPMGMDRFPDRFSSSPFPNQLSPMKSQMFEPNGVHFQRPRFQRSNSRQRTNSNPGQGMNSSGGKNLPAKASNASTTAESSAASAEKQTESSAAKSSGSAGVMTNPQNCHKVQNISDNSDVKSHSVSVENLSSSTSEMQLKKLCSSVGVVENIHLMKDQRKAVVKFKEPSQALSFQKKYQRYVGIDLLCSRFQQQIAI